MPRLPLLALVLSLGLVGCRWNPSHEIELQVRPNPTAARNSRGAPTDPLNFQCFFVSVAGNDIKPTLSTTARSVDTDCLGVGSLSGLVDKSELLNNGIKMTVSAGSNRTVRLMGIQGITQSCDQTDLATLIAGTTTLQVYQLGETQTDLYKDSEVTLENGYKAATATDLISYCTSTPTPTEGISGLGTLERIYVGSASLGLDPSDVTGFLPPENTAGQLGQMTSLAIDGDAVGSNAKVLGFNPLPVGGGNGFLRVDLIFSATINAGWNFRVNVKGLAGSSFFDGAVCGRTFQTLGTLSMALWDPGVVGWDTVASGNVINVVGPNAFKTTESGDLPTGQYFHVSLRSSDISDWNSPLAFGTCSAIQITEIFTEQYNPVLMSSNNYYGR